MAHLLIKQFTKRLPRWRQFVKNSQVSTGFTLVELVIVVPIAMVTVMSVVVVLVNLVSDNLTARGELSSMHDTQSALNAIELDNTLTTKYLTTKDAAFTDPYGPDNSGANWNFAGDITTYNTLILRTYATTRNPLDSQRTAVYINTIGCTNDVILSNPALTANTLYFIRNTTLYKRTLTNTSQTTCSPQFQKQSCPPDRATNNSICKSNDSVVLTDVSKFKIDYYSDPLSGTPIDVSSGASTVLDAAVSIKVTIKVSKLIAGQAFEYERSLFINKRNAS